MTTEGKLVRQARTIQAMRPLLSRIVRRAYPPGTTLRSASAREIGRFSFKHSLRYDLTLRRPGGRTMRHIIRGNIPSKDTGNEASIADRLQQVLTRSSFSADRLRAPASFGVVRRLRLHLYQDSPGIPLERLIERGGSLAVATARDAGRWLARLHRLRLQTSPRRTPARIERDANYFRDDVVRAAPAYLEHAVRLLQAATAAQVEVGRRYGRYFRTIHGDLNLDNIIASRDGSTAFIDFGNSVTFDPLSDVGNFFAQVDLLVWKGRCRRRFAQRLGRAFMTGYRPALVEVGPQAGQRIKLHRAWWSLQVLAYTLSIRPALGRRIARAALITAEQLLIGGRFPPPLALSAVRPATLPRALQNRGTMQAYFTTHLKQFFPGAQTLARLQLEHHRALSIQSYLMRYRLNIVWPDGQTSYRLVRGNRIDHASFAVMARVWQHRQGFASIRPLRYEPQLRYVFYEELVGAPLRLVPFRSGHFAKLVVAAGRALARFQRVPTAGLRHLTWSAERRFLRRLERQIKQGGPGALLNLRKTFQSITAAERTRWYDRRALVHHDFQASNIIAVPSGIGLIDFTQSGIGHPAIDLGIFRMHLNVMLHGHLVPGVINRLRERFTQAYLQSLNQQQRHQVRASLPTFELRSALDILAITLVNLGPRDPNRRRYVDLLRRLIGELLNHLAQP
ncbi:MAG: aminoglycoside phosphotransferase family protein [Candidatus Kerfeldbacteria bacterium]|nr:aminoglycoside phosphotransferase family protein [Candidatus Kerfeldbacteria bacterium]